MVEKVIPTNGMNTLWDRYILRSKLNHTPSRSFFKLNRIKPFVRSNILSFSKFYARYGLLLITINFVWILYTASLQWPLLIGTAAVLLAMHILIWQYARFINRLHQDLGISINNLFFLSEASKILSSSLDYKQTLHRVADLAVPHIADWCIVEMVERDIVQQVIVTHKNKKKIQLVKKYRKLFPISFSDPLGAGRVLQTGKSELYEHITTKMLKEGSRSEKQFQLLQTIGFKSAIIVPIASHRKIVGVLEFVISEPRHYFRLSDLAMAEELANRVGLAIENAALYKKAREAITARDNFITAASHELKTPITSLGLYLQILGKEIKKKTNGQKEYYLQKMQTQVLRLSNLIGDLLDASKINVKKLTLRKETFDLDALVHETVSDVAVITEKHEIVINGKIHSKVQADKYRIYQVLVNLLTNAIKYSPQADKVIITLKNEKKKVLVSVRDFGIGIDIKNQRKIFDRFYQVDKEQKTFPGLGMGLYISHNIIKRHGGELTIKSERGKGSTFTFTLPLIKKL